MSMTLRLNWGYHFIVLSTELLFIKISTDYTQDSNKRMSSLHPRITDISSFQDVDYVINEKY
jgi:hypothetical protein